MGAKAMLVLLLVAGALGVTLWLTDERPPVATTAENKVLEGRSLTQATTIRWQFHGDAPIEVGRTADGRFQLKEPIDDLASAAYLKQIVDTWDSANMRATPLADDEAGRRQAGLAPPQLTFVAEFPDRKRIEVEVGDEGPLGTTRFLRKDGRIWEGGEALVESMHVGLKDLRERAVFRHAFVQADELRVEQRLPSGRREALHLRLEDGEWKLIEPVAGRADPVAAQRFVTAVLSLRVDEFPPGIVRYPEDDPAIVLSVHGAYGDETVRLWEVDGQVYGQLPGRPYTFTSDNRQYSQIFVNAAEQLRARILVPMGESSYEELVDLIVDPGQGRGDRVRLARESQTAGWRVVEPVEFAARATPCNEAAHALTLLVAREFVGDDGGVRPRANDPRYGLGAGRWTVSTRRVREHAAETLWFGTEVEVGGEAMVYVCRSDEPDNVALVPKRPWDTLRRPWTEYVDRQVVRQTAVIERLDLEHRDGRQRRYTLDGEQWVLVGTEGSRQAVGEFANDVLRDLEGVQAVDMRQGFGDADWRIVMLRRNGDQLGLLRVWDRGGDARLICRGSGDAPVGFEVNAFVSEQLRDLWK